MDPQSRTKKKKKKKNEENKKNVKILKLNRLNLRAYLPLKEVITGELAGEVF